MPKVLGGLGVAIIMVAVVCFGEGGFPNDGSGRRGRSPAPDAPGGARELVVAGGRDPATARQAIAAGADARVAGTATFRGGPGAYAANIRALRGG